MLIAVMVQIYPRFNFYFSLFLGMVMYDHEFGTKGMIKFKPSTKLNHNIANCELCDRSYL